MEVFAPIFRALNANGIRYVVVGGLATVAHGHARLTSDIDLIIDLLPVEVEKAVKTFESMGFKPRLPVRMIDFANQDIRQQWIDQKHLTVFTLWNPKNPTQIVDIFAESPVHFTEIWDRSVEVDLQSTKIRIASLDDLITLKKIANRPIDIADIEKLEEIKKIRDK